MNNNIIEYARSKEKEDRIASDIHVSLTLRTRATFHVT